MKPTLSLCPALRPILPGPGREHPLRSFLYAELQLGVGPGSRCRMGFWSWTRGCWVAVRTPGLYAPAQGNKQVVKMFTVDESGSILVEDNSPGGSLYQEFEKPGGRAKP